MNPRTLQPDAVATLDVLLAAFQIDRSPRFSSAETYAAFVRGFEIILTGNEMVADYLNHLDSALGTTTPEGELPNETEFARFSAEGLGWMESDRIALLAIDRGAVTAMHEMVFDLWSDFWYERNVEREKYAGMWVEPSVHSAALKSRLKSARTTIVPSPKPAQARSGAELAVAFGETDLTKTGTTDRTIPVPQEQAIWMKGEPLTLTVTLNNANGQWTVRTNPLPILQTVQCSGWLADAALTLIRGSVEQTAIVFMVPSTFDPRYFVADYQSAKLQAAYAVALDDAPVGAQTFSMLLTAIAANLRTEDPSRADLLVDAASRPG